MTILKNTTGTIIKFAFAITFNEKRFAIVQLTIKNSTIYIVGDVLKYITCNVSEKFFITNIGTIKSIIIKLIPINVFKAFPPRNSLTSKISFP